MPRGGRSQPVLAPVHRHAGMHSNAELRQAMSQSLYGDVEGFVLSRPPRRADAQAGDAFGVPGVTITSFHLDQLRRSIRVPPALLQHD